MARLIPPHVGGAVERMGPPLGAGRAVLIAVHGRGAAPRNILLNPTSQIVTPDVTVLAPAAAGGAWYPLGFMGPTEQNEPFISSAIAVVHGLIDDAIEAGVPSNRIVLMGFSQGACLSLTAAQQRPMRYGGVLAYSGGLIGPPGTEWSVNGDFSGTPIFLGCSDVDSHIPAERVRESAAHLSLMGAEIDLRFYPGMGHLINEEELDVGRTLLADLTRG